MGALRERAGWLFKSDEELLKIGYRAFGLGGTDEICYMESKLYNLFPSMQDSVVARIVYLYNFYEHNRHMPESTWNGAKFKGFFG